jgi:beta-galactosidase
MQIKIFLLSAIFGLLPFISFGARTSYTINEAWRFSKGEQANAQAQYYDDAGWETVNIPHTWNAADAMSDPAGYYRGEAWYRRNIYIGREAFDKQVYIYFEGANQTAELFVNGQFVGKNTGGYTRFSFDITNHIKTDQFNLFVIKVDNSFNPDIPPLTADFTFFGGIYRDVYLQFTEKVHISLTDYASSGVYITTPEVSRESASVSIRTLVENKTGNRKRIRIEHTILSPDGFEVKRQSQRKTINSGSRYEDLQENIQIANPLLWDTNNPNLYTVYSRIYEEGSGRLLDEVHNPLGLRWFRFDASEGLFLNGEHVKLIGTNRHQCFDGKGNALPDELHVRDIMLLKEMGGNFLRVSHYPQDPVIMELCDKLGIVTSVEIPVINYITESEAFTQNSIEMAKAMIRQDFNRPSILIWNYMNEIMLRPPFEKNTQRFEEYTANVAEYGKVMEKIIREEDPHRYTMLVFHGSMALYEAAELVELPMLVGWNLYQGWYGGQFDGFDRFLDGFHEKYPDIPMFVSEYGADVDPRLHSFQPERFDFTAEYGDLYHEHYLKAIMDRPFISGANIWNLNDFHSESRGDAMPHINNKGITTTSRELKNTYLLYKSFLQKEPVVKIGSKGWQYRGGVADANGVTLQPLKIYSNAKEITVIHNSENLGVFRVDDNLIEIEIPFVNGHNIIEASIDIDGKVIRDVYQCVFRQIPGYLKDTDHPFSEINVTLGSNRYFEDKDAAMVFIPEQPYSEGSWGYVGGERNLPRTRFGVLPAHEINVLGTDHDPIFQTQRVNLEEFRLDVPDGRYSVYLYFAELESGLEREALAYNLGQDLIRDDFEERVFDVSINNKKVLTHFDLAGQIGVERAVVKKFTVNVQNDEGISIQFNPVQGKPVLNALRVYRMY